MPTTGRPGRFARLRSPAIDTGAIVAAVPSLFHYDSKARVFEGRVPGTVPEADG